MNMHVLITAANNQSSQRWSLTMAAFDAANRSFKNYKDEIFDALSEQPTELPNDEWEAACAEDERLCGVVCQLSEHMLVIPAPDIAGLLWKLEHLFGPEIRADHSSSDSLPPRIANALMSDARRLLTDHVA
jgi:hypothetical protein